MSWMNVWTRVSWSITESMDNLICSSKRNLETRMRTRAKNSGNEVPQPLNWLCWVCVWIHYRCFVCSTLRTILVLEHWCCWKSQTAINIKTSSILSYSEQNYFEHTSRPVLVKCKKVRIQPQNGLTATISVWQRLIQNSIQNPKLFIVPIRYSLTQSTLQYTIIVQRKKGKANRSLFYKPNSLDRIYLETRIIN